MSDEVAKTFEAQKPVAESASTGRSVTLSVTMHPNGQVDFQFPQGGKVLIYGMIELARAQFDKMILTTELQKAQASRGGMNGLLKRMNGG